MSTEEVIDNLIRKGVVMPDKRKEAISNLEREMGKGTRRVTRTLVAVGVAKAAIKQLGTEGTHATSIAS